MAATRPATTSACSETSASISATSRIRSRRQMRIQTRSPLAAAMRLGATLALVVSAVACGLDKQTAPSEVGPSGHALSLTLVATPNILPRDGESISVIRFIVRDHLGAPVVNQRLTLSTTAGTLSAGEVVTGTSGEATVSFTAPSLNQNVTSALIGATSFGSNMTSNVAVTLVGPTIPVASFTFTPTSPSAGQAVTFDATGSTLAGVSCGRACTYSWSFGDGGTGTGQITTHAFASPGIQTITLTVTSTAGGTSGVATQSLTVATPTLPTATFTVSPTAPRVGNVAN